MRKTTSAGSHSLFSTSLLCGSASLAMLLWGAGMAMPAWAQDTTAGTAQTSSDAADTSDDDSDGDVETVVVTGTRTGTNIADVAPVGTESVVMDREKILKSGLVTAADITRTLPQVQSIDSYKEGGTGNGTSSNTTQGNAINLRGLGAGATLTLVDGRRITTTGTATTFTEANQLPLAALERVEVLVDGASAIYGSDAVGGVVNYVMRKDYQGVQAAARYSHNHGFDEWGGSVTAGTDWDHLGKLGHGNILFTYDYDSRGHMMAGSQPFLRYNLTQYGGKDERLLFGSTSYAYAASGYGNIVTQWYDYSTYTSSYSYYANPGTKSSLTASDLTEASSDDDLNLTDASKYSTYIGSMWRHQVAIFANQEITPWLEVFYEGFFTKRKTTTSQLNTAVETLYEGYYYNGYNVSTTTESPYAVKDSSGSYLGLNSSSYGYLYQYIQLNLGKVKTENPDETYTGTFGFNIKMPGNWNGTGYFTQSLDHACGVCEYDNNVDTDALDHYIETGDINPLDGISDEEKSLFMGDNIQTSRSLVDDFVLKFDGPLFNLPGGTVKAAIGGEYSYSTEHINNASNRSSSYTDRGGYSLNPRTFCDDYAEEGACYNLYGADNVTGLNRGLFSAFAELYVPVIGEMNEVPFVQEFFVDSAARYDHYSDFGSTVNPKVGITWKVNDDFTARGSWGTSFRAPTLTDKNPYVYSASYVSAIADYTGRSDYTPWYTSDGVSYAGVLVLMGNSKDLKPEKSENWSAGWEFTPSWLAGFKAAMTYYSIAYTDKIDSPDVSTYLSSAANASTYSKYITEVDNTNCSSDDYDSAIDDAVSQTVYATTSTSYYCYVGYILDGRTQNLASQKQRGIDFNISYLFPTEDFGIFDISLNATTVLDNKVQSVKGGSFIQKINGYAQPVRWKGRMMIGWMLGDLNNTVFINYTGPGDLNAGGNTYALSGTSGKEAAYVTADWNISYSLDGGLWRGFEGMKLSMNVVNVFDINPPIALTSFYTAVDTYRYNVLGRTITFNISKDF